MKQEQFLDVMELEAARAHWHAALVLDRLPTEAVALGAALGRTLAEDACAPGDVPAFDRVALGADHLPCGPRTEPLRFDAEAVTPPGDRLEVAGHDRPDGFGRGPGTAERLVRSTESLGQPL